MNLIRITAKTALLLWFVLPAARAGTAGKLVVDPWALTTVNGLTNIVQAAAGAQHVVAVQPDGTLAFWASPAYLSQSSYKPFPSNLTEVTQVSALWHHGLALAGDGNVYAWGDPNNGATGVPTGLSNVVAVAAGTSTSYALLNSGRVTGWGDNSFSQRNPPASLTNAVAIAAGDGWCAALRSNRTITVWGNTAPAVGTANTTSNIAAIASGYGRLIALRDDGTVWSSANDVPEGLTNVVAIAAGYQQSLALTSDGALIKWPTTEVISGISNVIAIGGGFRTLAVADVRPIFVTHPVGRTNYTGSTAILAVAVGGSEPVTVQWLRDDVPLQGETNLSLVLTNLELSATASYSIVASNPFGATVSSNAFLTVIDGPPVISNHPASQRAFNGQTVKLKVETEGSMPISFQWRFNGENVLNANEATLLIPSIQPHQDGVYSVEITNPFGTVESSNAVVTVRPLAMWGTFPTPRAEPPLDLTNGIALSGGTSHFLALSGDGRLFAWGYTNSGATYFPAAATNVVWISAASGGSGNLVLTASGSVYGWGGIAPPVPPSTSSTIVATALGGVNYGLTSDGQVIQWNASVSTLPWSNIVQISAGINHVLCLQRDGLVLASGFNTYGQIAVPLDLSKVVAVAAGRLFSLALRQDGTVAAWGDNRYGQCNVPPGLSNIVAITGGDYTAFALTTDGTVRAWGRNDFGQTEVPEGLSNVIAIAAGQNQVAALIGPPELRNRSGTTLNNPGFAASSFCVEAAAARARTIVLEESQDGLSWSLTRAVAGSGLVQKICDLRATNLFKLYRVRSQ